MNFSVSLPSPSLSPFVCVPSNVYFMQIMRILYSLCVSVCVYVWRVLLLNKWESPIILYSVHWYIWILFFLLELTYTIFNVYVSYLSKWQERIEWILIRWGSQVQVQVQCPLMFLLLMGKNKKKRFKFQDNTFKHLDFCMKQKFINSIIIRPSQAKPMRIDLVWYH